MQSEKSKILIVDDEPEIVDVLNSFLSCKGYRVIGAFSGEEALSILKNERIDLILLDMRMPGLQGAEVARIVKERYPSIKIIVVTGYADETQSLYKDNILEGVFRKPVRLQELYNKLLEIFHREESAVLSSTSGQRIKARVLLIKAKLLFIEPSLEIYNFLSTHFKWLANKGEDYELDSAADEEKILEKLILFKPDILVVNATFLKGHNMDIFSKISENLSTKEIIIYHIEGASDFPKIEIERLTKSVEGACLKNGLLEIKWVEI